MSTQNGVYVFCAIREKESNQFGKVKLNGQEHSSLYDSLPKYSHGGF